MKRYSLIFSFICLTILCAPLVVLGADYKPLVGIPGVKANGSFDSYVNALYVLSISVAALLAVIKIIIAGVKWMMTDVVPNKGEAKKDIQGALIGLLVVLAAVLILTVINPKITNVNLSLNQLTVPPSRNEALADALNINLSNKDIVFNFPSALPASQRKEYCQARDEAHCDGTTGVKPIGCYVGEYYKTEDREVCIVREANYATLVPGDTVDCTWKGQGLPPTCSLTGATGMVDYLKRCNGISWDIFNQAWDCSAAQQACVDAGLDYDTSYVYFGSTRQVECEWP